MLSTGWTSNLDEGHHHVIGATSLLLLCLDIADACEIVVHSALINILPP